MDHMLSYFGSLESSRSFAVRSSGVDEDSDEMSAAGQMSSFLAVRGMRRMEEAIVLCWASQFSMTGTPPLWLLTSFTRIRMTHTANHH